MQTGAQRHITFWEIGKLEINMHLRVTMLNYEAVKRSTLATVTVDTKNE